MNMSEPIKLINIAMTNQEDLDAYNLIKAEGINVSAFVRAMIQTKAKQIIKEKEALKEAMKNI